MRRLRLFMFAVLCCAVMFGGCAKDDENDLLTSEFDKKGSLQGFIRDAITSALFSSYSDVKVTLMQGTDRRTPSVLVTDSNDQSFGLYAFSDIPVNLYSTNKNYVIKVTKPGYQDFYGIVNITAAWNSGGVPNPDTTRIDNNYNMLGNIYLFPVGTTAGDVKVKVTTPAGEIVIGATVRLQQNITGNAPYAEASGNTLAAAAGYMTSFNATTDSTGIATFDDTTLVLGGSYSYRVDPITYNNQQLTDTVPATNIVIGVNNVNQTIAMTAVTAEPNPLFVDIASNSTPGTIDSTGVLTLTFNQAINLSAGFETAFAGALTGSAVYDTGAGLNPVTTHNITAALSNGNKTLTITPKFSTYETTAGATVTYTYAGSIYIKNTQATVGGGFAGLTDKYGAGISNVVRLKAW